MKGLITILVCMVAVDAAAEQSEQRNPSNVLGQIESKGARAFLSQTYGSDTWAVIIRGIGSADDVWLEVYSRLEPASDAASAEELHLALYHVALPNAPFKVFPIIKDASCTLSFEAACPPDGITEFLNRLEKAVKKARTPEERKMRDSCLAGIAKTRAEFPNPKEYCEQ